MIAFIKTNKIELLMWVLVLLATSGFGVFVFSHVYGMLNVLITVSLCILAIVGLVILFEVHLKHRIHHFFKTQVTILNMRKLTEQTVRFTKKWGNFKILFQNSRLKMSALKLKR